MPPETIQCKFCGQTLSATATECDRCGGGTPHGIAVSDAQQQLESLNAPNIQRYEYRMVQIPPNISVRQATGNDAALYLQSVVNHQAAQGWEFVRVDTIGVYVPAGCLAGVFGGQSTTRQYYVVTFRKDF